MNIAVEYRGNVENPWIVVVEAGSLRERVVSEHRTKNAAIRRARKAAGKGDRIEAETKSGTTHVVKPGSDGPRRHGWRDLESEL